MDKKDKNNLDTEQMPIATFTEGAYLNYAMAVIKDRALPDIRDGLKPVQRRIIYSMNELSLSHDAKYKKSIRIVGEVLGKYHPHGDAACYGAMANMAQNFTFRYPLIDGQGNWGSVDMPAPAAARYTEARLSKFAEVLLSEVGLGCVDYRANFDGSLNEPVYLPSRLPHILINGSTGIAVGMKTDIPPHNVHEITNACIHLVDNPNATTEDLMNFVHGPDYPTKAEIISTKEQLKEIYETGKGSIRMRSVYEVNNRNEIIITALPHQIKNSDIVAKIAEMINKKELPMVSDVRDETGSGERCRIVIIPRSNRVDVEQLMLHLFAVSRLGLEESYPVNMTILGLDGAPAVKNLHTVLSEWLLFRTDVIKKRLNSRLDKINARLHLLDGFFIVLLNIDEVIRIIREDDNPKEKLMSSFGLTDIQAEYVLETKLRQLARLSELTLRKEYDKLSAEKNNIVQLLNSPTKFKNLLKKELKETAEYFGDQRMSSIVERTKAQKIEEKDLVPSEPTTVVISAKGWVRAAKGYLDDATTLSYKQGDYYLDKCYGKTNMQAVFISDLGFSYTIDISKLPSARGQGEPLTSKFSLQNGENIIAVLCSNPEDLYVVATNAGYGFICQFSDLITKTQNGKQVINVGDKARVLPPQKIDDIDNDYCVILSNVCKLLSFKVSELPKLSKGKGNKMLSIRSDRFEVGEEFVAGYTVISDNDEIEIQTKSGRIYCWSKKDLVKYESTRGRNGVLLPNAKNVKTALSIKKKYQNELVDESKID